MIKSTKKAFTLVELIVVITILAILGTIAFISLSGYSAEARDSRRITNISNLTDKINIELVRGDLTAKDLVDTGSTTYNVDTESITTWEVNGVVDGLRGAANFKKLRENGDNFRDPKANAKPQDYPLAIAIGGSGSGAYQFLQMAASMEAKNEARVRGNYNKESAGTGTTAEWLINSTSRTVINSESKVVIDGKNILPYDLN